MAEGESLACMYAVVGCSNCKALWIVADEPERCECPRCGTSRAYESRRAFAETDDENHAREVRARLLAARSGQDEAFESVASFGKLEDGIDSAGIDHDTYLRGMGLDPDEVAAACEGDDPGRSSRTAIVREAVEVLEEPTESAIVEYATDRGVPAEWAETALEKLHHDGAVRVDDGVYREL